MVKADFHTCSSITICLSDEIRCIISNIFPRIIAVSFIQAWPRAQHQIYLRVIVVAGIINEMMTRNAVVPLFHGIFLMRSIKCDKHEIFHGVSGWSIRSSGNFMKFLYFLSLITIRKCWFLINLLYRIFHRSYFILTACATASDAACRWTVHQQRECLRLKTSGDCRDADFKAIIYDKQSYLRGRIIDDGIERRLDDYKTNERRAMTLRLLW